MWRALANSIMYFMQCSMVFRHTVSELLTNESSPAHLLHDENGMDCCMHGGTSLSKAAPSLVQ